MRNKARLSITGSVGENGRVLTPDCPKAVHSGPSLRQSSGLALVSSDLPWKPKTLKCLKLHKTAKQTSEHWPYSNDAIKLSNHADKVDFERNQAPGGFTFWGATARYYTVRTIWLSYWLLFPSCTFKELVLPLRVKRVPRNSKFNWILLIVGWKKKICLF